MAQTATHKAFKQGVQQSLKFVAENLVGLKRIDESLKLASTALRDFPRAASTPPEIKNAVRKTRKMDETFQRNLTLRDHRYF